MYFRSITYIELVFQTEAELIQCLYFILRLFRLIVLYCVALTSALSD